MVRRLTNSLGIEFIKLLSPHIIEPRTLRGTHQRPLAVRLNALHKEIRDPDGIKEMTCSLYFFAGVLAAIEKVEDIGVPRLEVDGEGTWSLLCIEIILRCV